MDKPRLACGSGRIQLFSSRPEHKVDKTRGKKEMKKKRELVMVEIAYWCPYYGDRSVASGNNVMTMIMLVCLFKISLECIHADPQHHSSLSCI